MHKRGGFFSFFTRKLSEWSERRKQAQLSRRQQNLEKIRDPFKYNQEKERLENDRNALREGQFQRNELNRFEEKDTFGGKSRRRRLKKGTKTRRRK